MISGHSFNVTSLLENSLEIWAHAVDTLFSKGALFEIGVEGRGAK